MRNTSGRFFIWLIFVFFVLTITSIYFTHFFEVKLEPVNLVQNGSSSSPHLAGLILARGGSKGIQLKNIAKLKNVTLITRALQTMIEFGKFDSIWVSTDDENVANEAKKNTKVSIHWREAYTATDKAPALLAVKEFLKKHEEITRIGLVQCTSPFLKVDYLEEALKLLLNGYNSVFSISRQHKLRWGYNSTGHLQPKNFDIYHRPRRQDWDGDLVENGMFYFTEAILVKKQNVLQGGRIGIVEIPQNHSLEIDTYADLEVAELLMNHIDDS